MKEMNEAMVERIAERFRALADPTRIRILVRLQAGECNVSTLAQGLDVGQASVSKHLAVLRAVGFVRMRRDGTQAFCSILDPALPKLCKLMCDGVARHALDLQRSLDL